VPNGQLGDNAERCVVCDAALSGAGCALCSAFRGKVVLVSVCNSC
jgi:hypothetical protein